MFLGVILSVTLAGIKSLDHVVKKKAADAIHNYIIALNFRGVAFVIFLLFLIISNSLYIPENKNYWKALFIAIILYTLHTILLVKAYENTDAGIVAMLLGLSPIGVAVFSWYFLNEIPTWFGFIGIILCSFGVYLINFEDTTEPDRVGTFKKLLTDKGARIIFYDLIIISLLPSIDKIGIQYSDPIFWVFSTHAGTCFILFLIIINHGSLKWSIEMTENSFLLLSVGFLHTIIWTLQAHAYELMNVAYVVAIKKSGIIGAIIISSYWLDEKNMGNRIRSGFLIFIGVVLVILGS